jgi:hypothetical protein
MASIVSPPMEDNEDIDDFEVYVLDECEASEVQDNKYVQKLCDDCYLSILQRSRVRRAFHRREKEKALFQLFLSSSLWDSILCWTNTELQKKGKPEIPLEKLMAFIGLEMAMSLVQIGSIVQYWSKSRFSGHPDFGNTMSRTDFQIIRGSLQFHPPGYDSDIATSDPLYHCRCFLNNFQKNCISVAVPLGSSALDDGKYRKDSECFLCEVMGKDNTGSEKKFSKMGCFQCGQCYHLQCFNLMHHRHLNSSKFNTAMDLAIRGAKRKRPRNNVVTDPANRR